MSERDREMEKHTNTQGGRDKRERERYIVGSRGASQLGGIF